MALLLSTDLHGHEVILLLVLLVVFVVVVVLVVEVLLIGMLFNDEVFIGPDTKFESDLIGDCSKSVSLSVVIKLVSIFTSFSFTKLLVLFSNFSFPNELTIVRSSSNSFFDSTKSAARLVDGCGDTTSWWRFRYFSGI